MPTLTNFSFSQLNFVLLRESPNKYEIWTYLWEIVLVTEDIFLRKKRESGRYQERPYKRNSLLNSTIFNKSLNVLEELIMVVRNYTKYFHQLDNYYDDVESYDDNNIAQKYSTINRLAMELSAELKKVGVHHQRLKRAVINDSNDAQSPSETTGPTKYQPDNLLSPPNPVLQHIDYACCLFFTVELFLRLTFCPSKKAFFKSWLTWIDILSVIACINDFLINMFYKTEKYKSSPVDAVFLIRVVRIIRVFR